MATPSASAYVGVEGAPPRGVSTLLLGGVSVLALGFGLLAGRLGAGDTPVLALLVPLALVPVVVWRNPIVGLYIVLIGAVVIEQFGYDIAGRPGARTAEIPFFEGIVPGLGISAVEILLALIALTVLLQAVRDRWHWLWSSRLAVLMLLVLALVVVYFGLGVSRGGDLRMALWEVRPYVYLALAYFLARTLVTRASQVRPMLWILVLGAGFKAAYGVYLWTTIRNLDPRPERLLAHEESFFFGLFIFATVGMWLFGVRGKLRVVATMLLPVVVFAAMANSRRAAWLIFGVGLLVMLVTAAVRLPHRRKPILAVFVIGAVAAAIYIPAFWNSSGTIAQPARAVRSQIAPDPRDEMSNQYREIETYNLLVRIGEKRSTGLGFGIPITYTGLVDLSDSNPLIRFVPHNTVLYVWMRMGYLGMVLFTLLIAYGAMSASRLSAARSREVAFIGALTASATVAYAAMGTVDYGFFWFRNAIMLGILFGVVDSFLRRADSDDEGMLPELAKRGTPRAPELTGGTR